MRKKQRLVGGRKQPRSDLPISRSEKGTAEGMEAGMGRRPGIAAGKSSVAVACGRLSQCIKENGRIADLGLSAASRPSGVPEGEKFPPFQSISGSNFAFW